MNNAFNAYGNVVPTYGVPQQPAVYPYNGGQAQMNPDDIPLIQIQGEAAANQYPIAPGRTILLMDYTARRFWVKNRSANGLNTTITGHSFILDEELAQANQQNTPQTPDQQPMPDLSGFVSREAFDELTKRFEELNQKFEELMK